MISIKKVLVGLTMVVGLVACQASSGGTMTNGWSAVAAADVTVNVAIGVENFLKGFETQMPGEVAIIKTIGLALASAVNSQASAMVSGASPATQSEFAALSIVMSCAPNLTTLLSSKPSTKNSSVTALSDLTSVVIDEGTAVAPAILAANAGTTTAAQLATDQQTLTTLSSTL
jgi:hypothetical protein